MNILQKIIKSTCHRFKDSTLTTIFLTMSLVLSMVLLSVATSFVAELVKAQQAKEDAMPPQGQLMSIFSESGKIIDYNQVKQLLVQMKKGEGAILNNISLHLDQSEINTFCPVSAEYFCEDGGWHYPLIRGRYYTADEVKKGKKVVLIGKSLMAEMNQERYMQIEGERYEVLGVIGIKGQYSLWDSRLFIPVTALPQTAVKEIGCSSAVTMVLYSEHGKINKLTQRMMSVGKKKVSDMTVENHGTIAVEDILTDIQNNQDNIFLLAILGYLAALVYAINIIQFWVAKRRYEVGVRKAFGYSNRQIIGLLLEEMLGISGFACLLSFLIQLVLRFLVGSVFGYTMKLYMWNILVGIGVVLFTAIVVSLWPIRSVLNISPAIVLKEENDNA